MIRVYLDSFKTPNALLKIPEIVIGIICLTLLHLPFNLPHPEIEYLCYITYGGYLICTPAMLIGYLMDDGLEKVPIQEVLVNCVGAILYIASGSVLLNYFSHLKSGESIEKDDHVIDTVCGTFALLNGFLYFADALLLLQRRYSIFTNRFTMFK